MTARTRANAAQIQFKRLRLDRSFWQPWRLTRWRTWPRWFQIVWPLEWVTIIVLGACILAKWGGPVNIPEEPCPLSPSSSSVAVAAVPTASARLSRDYGQTMINVSLSESNGHTSPSAPAETPP